MGGHDCEECCNHSSDDFDRAPTPESRVGRHFVRSHDRRSELIFRGSLVEREPKNDLAFQLFWNLLERLSFGGDCGVIDSFF